jgi:hypothetical protein
VAKAKKDFIIGGSVVEDGSPESTGYGCGWRYGSFGHYKPGEESTRRKTAYAAVG